MALPKLPPRHHHRLQIVIDCNTPATKAAPAAEMARILTEFTDNIWAGSIMGYDGVLYDRNSIRVGTWSIVDWRPWWKFWR